MYCSKPIEIKKAQKTFRNFKNLAYSVFYLRPKLSTRYLISTDVRGSKKMSVR